MRLLPHFAFVAIIALFSPMAAMAEQPAADPARKLTCDACRDLTLAVQLGSNGLQGKTHDGTFRKVDGYVGLQLLWKEKLGVGVSLHGGRSWFSYGKTDDKTMSDLKSQLLSAFEVSVEVQGRFRLFERKRRKLGFALWIYTEYEAPLYRDDKLTITDVSFTSPLLMGLNVNEYAKSNWKMFYSWYRFAAGCDFKFAIQVGSRLVIPQLRIGYERFDSAVDLYFDKTTLGILLALNQDPTKAEGHHPVAYNTAIFVPGVEAQLYKSLWMNASGIAIPVSGNWFLGWMFRLEWRFK